MIWSLSTVPLLDPFWSMPQYYGTTVDTFLIERVQRRFLNSTAFILKINYPPYDHQPVMHKLGLVSLTVRRLEANLHFLSKLIN